MQVLEVPISRSRLETKRKFTEEQHPIVPRQQYLGSQEDLVYVKVIQIQQQENMGRCLGVSAELCNGSQDIIAY